MKISDYEKLSPEELQATVNALWEVVRSRNELDFKSPTGAEIPLGEGPWADCGERPERASDWSPRWWAQFAGAALGFCFFVVITPGMREDPPVHYDTSQLGWQEHDDGSSTRYQAGQAVAWESPGSGELFYLDATWTCDDCVTLVVD